MVKLSESQLGFVREWISTRSEPCRIPVPVEATYFDPGYRPAGYDTVTVVSERFIFPAPWTGKKELFYSCRVAFLYGKPIAASRSQLGETGYPWYDPTQWIMSHGLPQALNRIS